MDNPTHDPTKQLLNDCQDEQSKLNDENERLRAQITRLRSQIIDMERRTKTSIDSAYENGYESGYNAGRQDTRPSKQR